MLLEVFKRPAIHFYALRIRKKNLDQTVETAHVKRINKIGSWCNIENSWKFRFTIPPVILCIKTLFRPRNILTTVKCVVENKEKQSIKHHPKSANLFICYVKTEFLNKRNKQINHKGTKFSQVRCRNFE